MKTFRVILGVEETANRIIRGVEGRNISSELIDKHNSYGPNGNVVVLVFEKYFARNSSRASLTVTIDDLNGITQVHTVGSGGGQGVFLKFDWGAKDNFENSIYNILNDVLK